VWPAPAVRAVLATTGVAWLLTLGIAASTLGHDFDHGALEHIDAHPWMAASLAAAWVLMVGAMMLPTTLPLVSTFARAMGDRPERRRLVVRLLAGYVSVWLVAGIAFHAGDLGLHWLVHRWGWLADNTWAIAAGTLAAAGLYQFSGAKRRALACCRSADRLVRERGDAFRTGAHHAADCLACCWSLMLVMFSVGVASVAWMLALTVVMFAEKVTPAGHRASAPAGAWLLCCAALAAAAG
jgi:predicted metal-binding membrane protein